MSFGRGAVWPIVVAAMAVLVLVTGEGCHSTLKSDPHAFAAVELHGNTPGQIRGAALEVFQTNGFTLAKAAKTGDVYEKKGSTLSNITYGNWTGTPIWVRVRTRLVPIGEAAFELRGEAFFVRGKDEPVEEELPVSRLRAGQYQKILNQIAQKLHDAPRP